jgi:Spy/CpxP family protein refolding chaperone
VQAKIEETRKTFDLLKKSMDSSYEVINRKNESLLDQIKKLTSAVVINNNQAEELAVKMSQAVKELIESQVKLDEDIKRVYGIKS